MNGGPPPAWLASSSDTSASDESGKAYDKFDVALLLQQQHSDKHASYVQEHAWVRKSQTRDLVRK